VFAGRRFARVLPATAVLWGVCVAALAQQIPGYPSIDSYDAREVALLPKFCPYTLLFSEKVPGGSDPEQKRRWQGVLGPTFITLHHYCWGLMKTNRAVLLARDAQTRTFYLGDAINEFDYVIERAPPDFVLLPEILTKKGENLVRLGRGPTGIVQFENAITLKPDYWPPYAQMSDYYKELGDLGKAREALERGLAQAPSTAALTRRLEELEQRKGPATPKAAVKR
jgi:tetratricopeptide (TPR) repeat protein